MLIFHSFRRSFPRFSRSFSTEGCASHSIDRSLWPIDERWIETTKNFTSVIYQRIEERVEPDIRVSDIWLWQNGPSVNNVIWISKAIVSITSYCHLLALRARSLCTGEEKSLVSNASYLIDDWTNDRCLLSKHCSSLRSQTWVRGVILNQQRTRWPLDFVLVTDLDQYLCSHIETIRTICPIVNENKDQLIGRLNQSSLRLFLQSKSSPTNDSFMTKFFRRYVSFLTSLLMLVEIYCKYVLNELNDHIDISRNLWKNLNMADGRSLDQVEVRRSQSIQSDKSFLSRRIRRSCSSWVGEWREIRASWSI